jgi:hypothetical protein
MPETIRKAIDIGYVNENTALFGKMIKLTQYGDIISRYAIYQNMDKSMSEKEKMAYLDQLFVNYSYNEDKALDYANKIGLLMFTKYFIRTPKAIFKAGRKFGGHMFGIQAAQHITGIDIPDYVDTYYNPFDSLMNRFGNPLDIAAEVADPNIFNILPDLGLVYS